MTSLVEIFCAVDDFCQEFMPSYEAQLLADGQRQRRREGRLWVGEVMTLMIHFHQSHYRNFKAYYLNYVRVHLSAEFPGWVSYTRFVELMPSVLVPLCAYLRHCCGSCTGISYIGSTALHVCHNRRIAQHKVFDGLGRPWPDIGGVVLWFQVASGLQ